MGRLVFHRDQSRITDPSLVPDRTDTYVPLPNADFIERIEGMVDNIGLSIVDRRFKSTKNRQVVFGTFVLNDNQGGIMTQIGMVNSYNKQRRAGIAIGAHVHKCSNLSFSSLKEFRKHMGKNFFRDLNAIFAKAESHLTYESNKVRERYRMLRQVDLTDWSINFLMGKLFYDGIFGTTQISTLRKQLKGQKDYVFGTDTLFDFNMHVTEVLKDNHPVDLVENHMDAERLIGQHAMVIDDSLDIPLP